MLLVMAAGCDHTPDRETTRPAQFGFQVSVSASLVEEGRLAYQNYCVGCHGVNGDGNGEAAAFLDPKPRNFVNAKYRFSSTRSGQLPTDEDLKRTLRGGLRGSAMPSFAMLPERTVEGLIAYIKTFSPKWTERQPTAPVPYVEDPFRGNADKSEAVARGEAVYHGFATCWTCHPAYVPPERINAHFATFDSPPHEGFRPDLHLSVGKANDEGQLVYPPDFRRDFVRAGASVNDIYRSVAAGITGTAMPTWIDSIELPGKTPSDPPLATREDLWALSYYVQSLILQRPALVDEATVQVRNRPRPIYLHGAPPPIAEEPAVETPADAGVGASSQPSTEETFTP